MCWVFGRQFLHYHFWRNWVRFNPPIILFLKTFHPFSCSSYSLIFVHHTQTTKFILSSAYRFTSHKSFIFIFFNDMLRGWMWFYQLNNQLQDEISLFYIVDEWNLLFPYWFLYEHLFSTFSTHNFTKTKKTKYVYLVGYQ